MQLWSPSLVFFTLSFSVCLRTKVILSQIKEKKKKTKNIVLHKPAERKQQQQVLDVERYNKTTQHAFTTFIGSEIKKKKTTK